MLGLQERITGGLVLKGQQLILILPVRYTRMGTAGVLLVEELSTTPKLHNSLVHTSVNTSLPTYVAVGYITSILI